VLVNFAPQSLLYISFLVGAKHCSAADHPVILTQNHRVIRDSNHQVILAPSSTSLIGEYRPEGSHSTSDVSAVVKRSVRGLNVSQALNLAVLSRAIACCQGYVLSWRLLARWP
jgi:hypothetical protein